jgi:ABC-2 type transport system ATP-binding protein
MISADKLTMVYGPVVALNNATFEVRPGEVVGLLGPNGAGKSTAMKILTTYLYPTSGDATVSGHNVLTEPLEVRRKIGYLPEILPLYMDMEVLDYLAFVGQARGLGGERLTQRTEWVLTRCGLGPMYRKLIRELSKGFRQRTALAQALIHDPEVVILDEPTSGLDPHQIIEVRQLIRELAREKTVILSTHILQEAEAVSDRLVIISRGTIVGDGTLKELRDRSIGKERVRLSVLRESEEVQNALKAAGINDIQVVDGPEGCVTLRVEGPNGSDLMGRIGTLAAQNRWELRNLADDPFTLEEIFLALTDPEKPQKPMGRAS